MAQVKYLSTTYSPQAYKAFFDSLNCPLLSTEINGNNFYLHVGDIFTFRGPYNGNAGLIVKGTEVTQGGWGVDLPITVVYTDKLFFMYTKNSSANTRGLSFFYEELGDKILYGYVFSTSNNSFKPLDIIPLTDDVSSLQYQHSPRLNYQAQTGYIDYAPQKLFSSGLITDIEDDNFIACSTVTANQVVSFEGKNYYSIGTNTLVELDY